MNTKEKKTPQEIVREISWIAWHGAANAYRLYPENKHTFTEYWDAAKNQFSGFEQVEQKEGQGEDQYRKGLENILSIQEDEKYITSKTPLELLYDINVIIREALGHLTKKQP